MTDMKFSLPGPDTVTLDKITIDKLISARDGDAALLYLYILKTHGQSSSNEAAAALGKTHGGIATAMAILSKLGLVKVRQAGQGDGSSVLPGGKTDEPSPYRTREPSDEPRRHSIEDIKREMERGSVFYALVEAVQRSLGKIMSPDDMMRLFGIYDGLRMAPEVVLQLVTHCITESHGRSGGRMPAMKYIEKVAYTWEREGIISLEKAEAYLRTLDERKSAQGEIKRALQIRDREFSETEKRYVDNWIAMGFPAGSIEIAYDRTLVKTGKMAWGYMDTIINNWHVKGLHTPQEIMDRDKKPDRSGLYGENKTPGQKFGAAAPEEIERMQRLLNKMKEE